MSDAASLVAKMELRVDKFEKQLQRAGIVADQAAKKIEDRFTKINPNTSGFKDFEAVLSKVRDSVSTLGAALAVDQIRRYADEWTRAGNLLAAAGVQSSAVAGTQNKVADIAERSRASFEATSQLYASLTRSSKDLGATQEQVAVATEVVSKSLKSSGAGASETSAAILQLGQALSSGALQGDELRSLLENAPSLAQAIAKEFGVAVGELKQLGADGKLLAPRVFQALINAAPDVEKAFSQTKATVADAFSAIETAATRFIGQSTAVSGGMTAVANAGLAVAQNFELVATGATALGLALASRLLSRGLTPIVAGFAAADTAGSTWLRSATALSDVFTAFTTRAGIAAVAARAFGTALAIVGGPVGAALLAVTATIGYVASKSAEGAEVSKRYAAAMEEVRGSTDKAKTSVDGMGDAVTRTASAMNDGATAGLNKTLTTMGADATNLQTTLRSLVADLQQFGAVGLKGDEKARTIELLTKALDGDAESAKVALREIERLGEVNPSFASAFGAFKTVLEQLAAVRTAAATTRAELAGVAQQQAADREKAIAAKIPNPTAGTKFDDDAKIAQQDPVVRQLQTQAIIRKEKAKSAASETEQAITAIQENLQKQIAEAGGAIDTKAIRAAAEAINANNEAKKGGGGGRKADPEKPFENAIQQVEKMKARLVEETAVVGQSDVAMQKARVSSDLYSAAKKSGITISDEIRARIQQEADAYAKAAEAFAQAKARQDEINSLSSEFGGALNNAFDSLVIRGEKVRDVLRNLAQDLAQMASRKAFQAIFDSPSGGGSSIFGGLLSSLFGGGGGVSLGGLYHSGGIVGQGTVGRSVPASAWAGAPRFHSGLMTDEVAAILKKGEVVLTPGQVRGMGAAMSSGGGINVVMQNTFTGGVTATDIARMLPELKQQAIAGVAEAVRRGTI